MNIIDHAHVVPQSQRDAVDYLWRIQYLMLLMLEKRLKSDANAAGFALLARVAGTPWVPQ
jgi:hypothetical protein